MRNWRAAWVYKGDIRAYFASVPHGKVMDALGQRVNDGPLCERIERALHVPLAGGGAARGLAVGSLVSQHLANLYLGALDHWVTDGLGLGRYLRYMDDFLVFGERDRLRALAARLPGFLAERLDLSQMRLVPFNLDYEVLHLEDPVTGEVLPLPEMPATA